MKALSEVVIEAREQLACADDNPTPIDPAAR
jgi:hypothetical protein